MSVVCSSVVDQRCYAMFTGVEFCTEDIQLFVYICLRFGGNCQSDCSGLIPIHQGQVVTASYNRNKQPT